MTNTRFQSRTRDFVNGTTIDRLALSRAQHLQSRANRPKSISDDDDDHDIDAISDWSDSDRECDLLSDFGSTINSHENGLNGIQFSQKTSHVNVSSISRPVPTTLPNISDSTISAQISFVMESEKPKQRYVKNQSSNLIRTRKNFQPPLLPARRAQTKQTSPSRSVTRSSTTIQQLSRSSRNSATSSQNSTRFTLSRENSCSSNFNSHLGTDSSMSTYSSFQTHDDSLNRRQIFSPTSSQSSIPRAYEMKKIFTDDDDYGRLLDSSAARPSQPRGRQKWGTIVHPPFPLGYQYIAPEQVTQVVERLTSPARCRDRHLHNAPSSKRYLSVEETDALINRLTKVKTVRTSEQYWPVQRQTGFMKTFNNNWKGAGITA